MRAFVLQTTLLLLSARSCLAHAGHDHDHDHDHDHHVHSFHSDGTVNKNGGGLTHTCQHDAIEALMKEAKATFKAETLATIAAEVGTTTANVQAHLRRRMDTLSERRQTSSYHPLRVTYDFTRLGTSTADLANGADTHKTKDFTCYDGGPATVPNSYSATSSSSDFTCTSGSKFTDEKRSFLKFTLLPQAKTLLANALTVADADQAPNSPNDVWTSQACFNSGTTSLPGECGWDKIPDDKKSVSNSDFVLYIMARPTDTGVIAWATTLVRDPVSGRPLAGVANFNPEYLSQPKCSDLSTCLTDSDCGSGKCSGNFESQLGTTIHEIVHALGFSSSSWGSFVGKTQAQVVEQRQKADGSTRSFIITKNVVDKVKAQYGCSDDTGGEIEDLGGGGTAGSHWEKRVIANEFMNPQVADSPVLFSAITLGLFEDTGWYKPNYGAARHLAWGYKQGCNFIKQTCGIGWDNKYFCDREFKSNGGRQEGCSSFDFRGRGYCDAATYSGSITPSYYQYFSDAKIGGRESYMDYCPIYKPYANTPCNRGSARNGALRAAYGEHADMLNENGFCFSGTYQFQGVSSSNHQACHEVTCAPDLQTYTVKFYDGQATEYVTITCPTNGGLIDAPAPFQGKLECYPANLICYVPTNCPKDSNEKICSGHGTCGSDLSCTCAFGYTGPICQDRQCPIGIGNEECSGSNGVCDTNNGKCTCASTHDGNACDRLKCPITTKAECNGRGACSNATWPTNPNNSPGECICDAGYTGVSCNRAPGCPNLNPTCSNHGTCNLGSGACACAVKEGALQTNPQCKTKMNGNGWKRLETVGGVGGCCFGVVLLGGTFGCTFLPC